MNAFRVVKIIILGFGLVMVGLAIHKNYLFPQSKGIGFAGFQEGLAVDEEWMGIYFKGEKVGCSVTKTSRLGDGYDIFEHSIIIFGSSPI